MATPWSFRNAYLATSLLGALVLCGSCLVNKPYPGVYAPTNFAPGVVPRVMFWPGKVAQHINPMTGAWETDPDGIDGGAGDGDYAGAVRYCQKWYVGAIDIRPYADETITTWRERGNVNAHTKTRLSYECVLGSATTQGAVAVATPTPGPGPAPTEPPSVAVVPRVMFWPGKVAQHIDLATGRWETDPDGVSGGAMDALSPEGLAYCHKWYTGVVAIRPYADETIATWRELGNVNAHAATRRSYECVAGTPGGVRATPADPRVSVCSSRFLPTVTTIGNACGAVDLPKLAAFSDLEELTLELRTETTLDIASLRGLHRLRTLRITGPALKDISALAALTQLTALELNVKAMPDLSPLAGLTQLERLSLHQFGRRSQPVPVRVDALASLTHLRQLDLSMTPVEDISPLVTLKALTTLNLASTQVADFAPLARLTALQRLSLERTKIVDLTPLGSLTQLGVLKLNVTQVASLTPIAGLVNMRVLSLIMTEVNDLGPVAAMTHLRELHIAKRFASSTTPRPPLDVRPLARLRELETLSLGVDRATSLEPLRRLTSLKTLVLPADQSGEREKAQLKRWIPGVVILEDWGFTGNQLTEMP